MQGVREVRPWPAGGASDLTALALKFGTWEFFWLATLGVVVAGSLCAPADSMKGWIAGFLGLLLNTVGQDGIHAWSSRRSSARSSPSP